MKVCDNCGKKIEYTPIKFPIITVEIEAILDMCGHKKIIDLCSECQKNIYNMIVNNEVQNNNG